MVTLLVSLGANMEIPSENGETALVFAVHEQNAAIVETLVHAGANVNHLDSTRENLLLRAVRAHRPEVLRALLSHETNAVSTAFIDSAFAEAVMHPVYIIDLDFYGRPLEMVLEKQNQVNRIDMICQLIPMVSDFRLVSDHNMFDKCLQLDEATPNNGCHMCDLLLKHGFAYSRNMFYDNRNISEFVWLYPSIYNKLSRASFARLLIPTSDDRNLLKTDVERVMQTVPSLWRMHPKLCPLYRTTKLMIRSLSDPLSLQDLCVITARKRLRGRMWSKIDTLPLPPLLKDKLKLLHTCG